MYGAGQMAQQQFVQTVKTFVSSFIYAHVMWYQCQCWPPWYARRPVAVSLPVETKGTIKQIFAGILPIVARDPNREGRLFGTT